MLQAVNPVYAIAFFQNNQIAGFLALGSVVLAVTGAEALYADMGHFGKGAIRIAWWGLVLPALLLNYFGQGALILNNPQALENPFYHMAPGWALMPLIVLATAATVIASQAVISGAYSITRQAIQLGYLPRMRVLHTSSNEIGQVYIPFINNMLAIGVAALVLGLHQVAEAGQHDHGQRRSLANAAADLHPVEPGQHHVEHHQVRLVRRLLLERGEAVPHDADGVALALQVALDDLRHHWLVLDDEHPALCRRCCRRRRAMLRRHHAVKPIPESLQSPYRMYDDACARGSSAVLFIPS